MRAIKTSLLWLCGVVFLSIPPAMPCCGAAESTNPPPAAELTGSIFAKDSAAKALLYKFKRRETRNGSRVNVVREYTTPEGSPVARERVFYDGSNLISYELDELQVDAAGSARVQRDAANPAKMTIAFEYNKDVHDTNLVKTSSESARGDVLVGDMMADYLKLHWNELFRGEKVKFRYIVVPRRETIGFAFSRHAETTVNGHPALIIKMEPSSPIIAALVDPIYFKVEKESQHRVFEYIGRVVPKVKKDGKWQDLDALVTFDWKE